MAKPVSEWTEDDVLALPRGETDWFERKGSRLLDLSLPNVNENTIREELAKQLSAFANTGGGQIIYGIADNGTVDNGGVSRIFRGKQSTKEWLEDVIPVLTDFEITGFNVFEIQPKPTESALASEKSLYVVDVPDSDRAPHQSRSDQKYYLRSGGKSRPAAHRLIEDVRNRVGHPLLEVYDVRITSANHYGLEIAGFESQFELITTLRLGVRNRGKVRAANACLRISATVPVSSRVVLDNEYFHRSASPGTILLELKNPLYPGMDVEFGVCISASATVLLGDTWALSFSGQRFGEVVVSFLSFADSAPPQKQEFKLADIDPTHYIKTFLEPQVREQVSRVPQGRVHALKRWSWS